MQQSFNLQGLGGDLANQANNNNQQGGNRFNRQRRVRQQNDQEYVPRIRHRGQRPVDIYSSIIAYLDRKKHSATNNPFTFHVPPHEYYCKDVLPSFATPFNPSTALCTQWAHTSQYPDSKMQANVGGRPRGFFYNMKWSANGRKLLSTTDRGDFVLWNGASFTAEMKTTAHKSREPVRALAWGAKSGIVITGDDTGTLCLWNRNFSQAAEVAGTQRALRDVCFSSSELKFCTGGQDATCGIWDVERFGSGGGAGKKKNSSSLRKKPKQPTSGSDKDDDSDYSDDEDDYSDDEDEDYLNNNNTSGGNGGILSNNDPDTKLTGHGGDVMTVRWHPYHSLIATGSQDKDIRLWDPRVNSSSASKNNNNDGEKSTGSGGGGSIATLQGHGESVTQVRWHDLGRTTWLLSGSKDGSARLWDIRNTRHEVSVYQGHIRSVNTLEWHPTHPDLFATGGHDGLVAFWIVSPNEGTLRSNGVTYEVSKYAAGIEAAHEKWRDTANPVHCLAWSPMGGHVLATGSAELHIWTRNKPGAIEEMRFESMREQQQQDQQQQDEQYNQQQSDNMKLQRAMMNVGGGGNTGGGNSRYAAQQHTQQSSNSKDGLGSIW